MHTREVESRGGSTDGKESILTTYDSAWLGILELGSPETTKTAPSRVEPIYSKTPQVLSTPSKFCFPTPPQAGRAATAKGNPIKSVNPHIPIKR